MALKKTSPIYGFDLLESFSNAMPQFDSSCDFQAFPTCFRVSLLCNSCSHTFSTTTFAERKYHMVLSCSIEIGQNRVGGS